MPDNPTQHAESVRCSDCNTALDRYAAWEIRGPQTVTEGVASTHTFWTCPTCWDRMIGRAVLSAVRGF